MDQYWIEGLQPIEYELYFDIRGWSVLQDSTIQFIRGVNTLAKAQTDELPLPPPNCLNPSFQLIEYRTLLPPKIDFCLHQTKHLLIRSHTMCASGPVSVLLSSKTLCFVILTLSDCDLRVAFDLPLQTLRIWCK